MLCATKPSTIQEHPQLDISNELPQKEISQVYVSAHSFKLRVPITSKTSKVSLFSEEDIEAMTKFLETQPLGLVPRSAFQQLAEQVRPFEL